jgi:hypothetical protein
MSHRGIFNKTHHLPEEGVAAKPLAMQVSEVAMQVSEFSILQLAGGARL